MRQIGNMINGHSVLKFSGALVFFFGLKFIMQAIFGSYLEFFINNYWFFVAAGLIPAYLFKIQGYSVFFFPVWVIGAFYPTIMTIVALTVLFAGKRK